MILSYMKDGEGFFYKGKYWQDKEEWNQIKRE